MSTAYTPIVSPACADGKHHFCGGWILGAFLCACWCHRPVVRILTIPTGDVVERVEEGHDG